MSGRCVRTTLVNSVPYTDDMPENEVIPSHALGIERPGEVLHMCPDINHSAFCSTCYGAGTVTTQQLGEWQMRQNAEINRW